MDLVPIEAAKFHRLFYPVVAVVVVVEHRRHVGGMAAISCVPLSFMPPLVGVSVAPTHYTHQLLARARRFTLNWLGVERAEALAFMGSAPGRHVPNKVEAAGLSVARYDGIVGIKEAEAVLTCRWQRRYRTGDHELVVSRVERGFATRDFQEYWQFRTYRPALYVGGGEAVRGPNWFRTVRER